MTTWSEVAVDHCMRGEEALCVARRLEALHLPLSSPGGSMRIFGSIIQVPAGPMPDVRKYRSVSDSIAAQTVRDEAPRLVFQPVQQALEETLGSGPVPPLLHQEVQHDAMLIHRSQQIVQHAPDADEHLVEVPGVLQAAVGAFVACWQSRRRTSGTSATCGRVSRRQM